MRIAKSAETFLTESGQQDKIKNYKWEFNLIEEDKTVNAWVMPGGKATVYTGILPFTQTDTTSFSTALELRRKKRPTDFFFGAYYFFGSTKESKGRRATTENRLLGRTRLDRDLTNRSFAFGQVSAEYDEIQNLSLRTDPVAGVGYRFVAREKLTISGRSGPGYVYQRYFGGDTEDYFTILFGGDLEADLPYGSKFRWGAEYLPAVPDWKDNYLIRTTADWTMPIIGWLDFKIAVFDTYNNRPPSGTDRNSFTTTAGVSFRF